MYVCHVCVCVCVFMCLYIPLSVPPGGVPLQQGELEQGHQRYTQLDEQDTERD